MACDSQRRVWRIASDALARFLRPGWIASVARFSGLLSTSDGSGPLVETGRSAETQSLRIVFRTVVRVDSWDRALDRPLSATLGSLSLRRYVDRRSIVN